MTSLRKMLNVLEMFSSTSMILDIDTIAQSLQLSRPTAYRYIKELCDSGLLTKKEGHYTLGPKIPELDWLIREHDPLIYSSRKIMSDLAELTGLSVFICVFYNDQTIKVHLGAATSATDTSTSSLERGRPLPLFKGAPSKAIVSFLKGRQLRKFFDESIDNNLEYNCTWKEFSQETKLIRKDGYCFTSDELGIGFEGIAAPIINTDTDCLLGSLSVAGPSPNFDILSREGIIGKVVEASQSISNNIFIESQKQETRNSFNF